MLTYAPPPTLVLTQNRRPQQAVNPSPRLSYQLDDCSLERLALEVVAMAIRDAISPPYFNRELSPEMIKREAREWLLSEEGQAMIEATGYDGSKVGRWIAAGCPGPELPAPKKTNKSKIG